MILTGEEREAIAKPFIRSLGGDYWNSGDDGIKDDGDIERFAAAIRSRVSLTHATQACSMPATPKG
jgi:hypothetical protein